VIDVSFRLELTQQLFGGCRDFDDRLLKGGLIHTRGYSIPAHFANELERGFICLLIGCGLIGAAELFDTSAHGRDFTKILSI
jgi:hypothetical protein